MMLLDPSNEDGVCSVDYAEWKAEPYDSDGCDGEWYDDEQDNEWECD